MIDIQINLFGSLRKEIEGRHDSPIRLQLNAPAPLSDILEKLKIPTGMVQLAMVNYRAVPLSSTINPGDRLSLFSREYPVFADWKDLRF
jgi:hypothetical protein